MYIVLLSNNVVIKPNLKMINKKLKSALTEDDFNSLGKYKVVRLDKTNLDFVKDIKIMESIPMKLLYKKDMLIPMLIGINILISFILLVKG